MRTLLFHLLLIQLFVGPIPASAANPAGAVTIALLAEPRLPNAEVLRSKLEKRLAGRVANTVSLAGADQETVTLRVGDHTIFVFLLKKPVPEHLIMDLCTSAWYWNEACDESMRHRAQAGIQVRSNSLDKLGARLLLTDAVAAFMDDNTIASYWVASLQSRDAFLQQASAISRDAPPVWLWVNFRISNDVKKGFSLSTSGMDQLDLLEIESKDVKRPGMEVFSLLYGMAEYLASKGPVIKDGETIGESPKLNIRVQQGPSYWRKGLKVYRVTWPN